MHEFETFAYLDVQKTGSSFVSIVLQRFAKEEEVYFRRHARVGDRYDPSKFYFISVRHPLDQYISLYSHGCGGRGGLLRRLRKKGYDNLYDSTWSGFRRWLSFVLDPESGVLLDRDYGRGKNGLICDVVGFQTYRFLELAMREPIEPLRACRTKDDVRAAFREQAYTGFTIRYETFSEDLKTVLSTHLKDSISDLDAALRFIDDGQRVNTSERVDAFESELDLGAKNVAALREREWFLQELFGYEPD